MNSYQLTIKGMGCQNCINAVTKALNRIETLHDIKVSLGEASFNSTDAIDRGTIITAIDEAGFEATFTS